MYHLLQMAGCGYLTKQNMNKQELVSHLNSALGPFPVVEAHETAELGDFIEGLQSLKKSSMEYSALLHRPPETIQSWLTTIQEQHKEASEQALTLAKSRKRGKKKKKGQSNGEVQTIPQHSISVYPIDATLY